MQGPARQPPLIVVAQLRATGLSDSEIKQQVRHAHRVRRGVYSEWIPPSPQERHLLHARAVLATHPSGVYLSHVSAALAHGLPQWRLSLDTVHVMGATNGKTRCGITYHDGAGQAVSSAGGLPATTVAQSVWDCARTGPFDGAVVLGDAALHRGMTTPAELEATREKWRRTKGAARAGRVLASLDGAAESPGESRGRLLPVDLGYSVDSQFRIEFEGGHYRADFRIRGTHVLVEVDGRVKYAERAEETVWREKIRTDRITNLGFEIVRLSWHDLGQPALVDRMVRRALGRRR